MQPCHSSYAISLSETGLMKSIFMMVSIRGLSIREHDTQGALAALLSLASGLALHSGSFAGLQQAVRHMHNVFQ